MNPAFKGKRPEERHQIILLAILGELRALNEALAKKPKTAPKQALISESESPITVKIVKQDDNVG